MCETRPVLGIKTSTSGFNLMIRPLNHYYLNLQSMPIYQVVLH